LLIGFVAERDGIFAASASFLARLPVGGRALLVVALGLVAAVTAVLNLDTPGASPSIRTFSSIGVVLMPITLAAALIATS
jgi:Na+/H+ antiporter NhaD/arsenite permease-like protein